jgi:hypothetical protein
MAEIITEKPTIPPEALAAEAAAKPKARPLSEYLDRIREIQQPLDQLSPPPRAPAR